MYSFEGQFREKPQQNLAGSSKRLPRDELIQHAAEERRKREDTRRKTRAATVIQSHFRSFAIRKQVFHALRLTFDEQFERLNEHNIDSALFSSLIRSLLMFYREGIDDFRLSSIGQLFVRKKESVIELVSKDPKQWFHRLKKLLHFNIQHLSNCISGAQQTTVAIPLRLIEIYTTCSTYACLSDNDQILASIWSYLVNNGYFSHTRKILDTKVPEPYEESIKPPTPMASSVLDLALRPLQIGSKTDLIVVLKFFADFLREPFSPQIKYFVLPVISKNIPPKLQASYVLSAFIKKTSEISVDLNLPSSTWLLYSVLKIMTSQLTRFTSSEKVRYLLLLKELSFSLPQQSHESAIDEDEEAEKMEVTENSTSSSAQIIDEIMNMINDSFHVNWLISILEEENWNSIVLIALTQMCNEMMALHRFAVNNYRLLYTLAFKSAFLKQLWNYIISVSTPSVFGSPTPLLQILSRGLPLAAVDWHKILPQLTLFCSLFSYLLPTLDDVEFYEEAESEKETKKLSSMPFTLKELQSMTLILKDVCIGLIELAYHDTKLAFIEDYKTAMRSVRNNSDDNNANNVKHWLKLFKTSVYLLRQLYKRDSRRQFCPDNHWISKQVVMSVERPTNFRVGIRQRERYQQFIGLRKLTRQELEEYGPPLSTTEIRNITILQEIPFVVPFHDRVKILQSLMSKDKEENIGNLHQFMVPGSSIAINIRRNYIYEDAFEKLSTENEPDLKRPIRVQLVNAVGLDEAGIDGGGIFREFLSELLKTAFDPNRGFFRSTHDRLLYPNAAAHLIVENYQKHYFFIGRMLGKALYENMLVELPFSPFFLEKILAKHTAADIDIHHLATLDPLIYKNLVYLKNYEGDVSELGLDFTVVNSDFGENEVVELKPGGSNIPVTAQNRIEYIHLMADYRLNKQIRNQCLAFKQGLANVIDLDWIRMFDAKELQTLISGAQTPIDIEDLKAHCNYSGGYASDHKMIVNFWKVVSGFNERQKRLLLKFVTSCSRPPLLGFKDLHPPFCIQSAGREDRLPTASTCMNLLKLPEFPDEATLRQRLQYAIESGVGFELS
ncbi:ubiquitin-protein ligase E3C-like protein [Dinothrombium tinctorium]|uniref:Ubiquitin-protein ligase E3C n=1 Tax=Dinothrombium tinctorium TaxID=1965070 RepID=A0A443QY02_9ACAR|nr:ubiquitin-protein ligase E3C-like protein [Dinothrombium tinctorium]RWS08084.1 ubiquitin-protein ligase E3C-like protein [Dinothrombium tinctorium]